MKLVVRGIVDAGVFVSIVFLAVISAKDRLICVAVPYRNTASLHGGRLEGSELAGGPERSKPKAHQPLDTIPIEGAQLLKAKRVPTQTAL